MYCSCRHSTNDLQIAFPNGLKLFQLDEQHQALQSLEIKKVAGMFDAKTALN